MIVTALLPCLFIALLWRWLTLRGLEMREALLAANVISGALIVVSTEVLTVFQQLHFISLLIFWLLLTATIGALLVRLSDAFKWSLPLISRTIMEKVFFGMAAVIIVVVGFIALYAPPNTWDSLTYHMARVGHWQQNNGVMNYPTGIIRQLVLFPFAEYVILHLQILSGGDRLANMVQWSAMVLSAVGVSLAACLLGASRVGQIAAALLALTLPMGILQGSSTQNDYVVASLAVSTVCFLLKFIQESRWRWVWLTAVGMALTIFTKGTGLLLVLPFVVLSFVLFRNDSRRKMALVLIFPMMLVVLTGPFCLRLMQIDRNPLAAIALAGQTSMERVGFVETGSNILRQTATQLALPFDGWNKAVEKIVLRAHEVMGVKVVDPQTTFGALFKLDYSPDEDVMPNPWHILLVMAAGICFWFIPGKGRIFWFYVVSLALVALVFCVMVKWQPWISRFHLPIFILAMPLTAAVIERGWPKPVVAGILIVAFLGALHPLVLNNTRRLCSNKSMFLSPREQLYFARDRGWFFTVKQVANSVKALGCRDVGLKIGSDEWEYSWQEMFGPQVRVEHVGVGDRTAAFTYPKGAFDPCAVIDMASPDKEKVAVFNERPFVKVSEGNNFALYISVDFAQRMSGKI